MRRKVPAFILFCLGAASAAYAADPAWWRATTPVDTHFIDPVGTYTVSDNYAPVNQGQLKNVVTKAAVYLDNTLPSPGAGSDVHTEVTPWITHTADDYSPVNLGQLKAVAKPFYVRLLQSGYDTRFNLISHGYPSSWTGDFPWNEATPTSENYTPANLGQLKMVFSFSTEDIPPENFIDSDGDGLPDGWEVLYGMDPGTNDQNQDGINDGLQDFDGDGVSNSTEFQNGTPPQTKLVILISQPAGTVETH